MARVTSNNDEHPLVVKWRVGAVTVGCSCKISSPLAAEAIAARGLDYVYVDQQHGVFDNLGLLSMFQAVAAAGSVPLTRVPANRPDVIGGALDMGAMGVIIPTVETAEDASMAAQACSYPPNGVRSHGHVRPADVAPVCIVLVETSRGLENVRSIAETPGVDVVMVGAQDLALSLGIALDGAWLTDATLSEAIADILAACEQSGTTSGIGAASAEEAGRWIEDGFQMVNLGSDLAFLRTAVDEHLAIARGAIESAGR